jgi:hypothetical protein
MAEVKKPTEKPQSFYLPDLGRTVEAENLEEAIKKVKGAK